MGYYWVATVTQDDPSDSRFGHAKANTLLSYFCFGRFFLSELSKMEGYSNAKNKKMNSHNYYRISHRSQNIRHHCFEAPFILIKLRWHVCLAVGNFGRFMYHAIYQAWQLILEEDWALYVCHTWWCEKKHCNVQTEREENCGGSPSFKGPYEFVRQLSHSFLT